MPSLCGEATASSAACNCRLATARGGGEASLCLAPRPGGESGEGGVQDCC